MVANIVILEKAYVTLFPPVSQPTPDRYLLWRKAATRTRISITMPNTPNSSVGYKLVFVIVIYDLTYLLSTILNFEHFLLKIDEIKCPWKNYIYTLEVVGRVQRSTVRISQTNVCPGNTQILHYVGSTMCSFRQHIYSVSTVLISK